MKHTSHIRFDMEDEIDLSTDLIEVKRNFYTKHTRVTRNSVRFAIPQAMITDLKLKAKDPCFFYQTLEGFYLSFKEYPSGIIQDKVRERRLTNSGGSLYLIIPPMIKNLYLRPIKGIKLIQTKGLSSSTWQIQFLFTDFT